MNKTTNSLALAHSDILQCLDKQGAVKHNVPGILSNHELLKRLYQQMLLIRLLDEKLIHMHRTGNMGTFPNASGQEAIPAALGAAMNKHDILIPYYRDQYALLQRDVTITELLSYWAGDERGSHYKNNNHDFPLCVPIATQYVHAVGVAYAIKYRQEPKVVVSCCGDGATSKGDFYEAINAAGAWDLPVIFVVINNQWAISVPLHKQTRATNLSQKAHAAGIEGLRVDGNDVVACYSVFKDCMEKIHNGQGPFLIEAVTYRLCDHTTVDDGSRYQPKAEFEQAKQYDPLNRLKSYMEQNQLWDDSLQQQAISQCKDHISQAIDELKNIPPQNAHDLFDYLYAKLPACYQHQRDELGEIGE